MAVAETLKYPKPRDIEELKSIIEISLRINSGALPELTKKLMELGYDIKDIRELIETFVGASQLLDTVLAQRIRFLTSEF